MFKIMLKLAVEGDRAARLIRVRTAEKRKCLALKAMAEASDIQVLALLLTFNICVTRLFS
jgi:hypothetical protein